MPKKLTNVQAPRRGAEPITDVTIHEKRPVLGMTLIKTTGTYSLDEFSKFSKKHPERQLFSELLALQKEMYRCENMTRFLERFHTRNGEIDVNSKKALKDEIKRVRDTFGVSLEKDMIHIHNRPRGKGIFTLFGFVYDNVFEVLLLDPGHIIANMQTK